MTIFRKHLLMLLIAVLAGSANLAADILPVGDSLSIVLDPLNGVVDGPPGAIEGWGFTVDWTSTNGDWLSFTGTSIGSVAPGGNESNPGVLAGYTDFISAQGGPVDFAIPPTYGPWAEAFDGVSQGVGAYQITSDYSFVGSEDTGQITFDYEVTNEDPTLSGYVDLDDGSYYGSSTQFSVTVDPVPNSVPEPSSFDLLLSVVAAFMLVGRSRRVRNACSHMLQD